MRRIVRPPSRTSSTAPGTPAATRSSRARWSAGSRAAARSGAAAVAIPASGGDKGEQGDEHERSHQVLLPRAIGKTLGSGVAEFVRREADSRSAERLILRAPPSEPGRSAISLEIDANATWGAYRGGMRLARFVERRGVDALVVLLAAVGQLELWVGSPPSSVAAVAAALAPLPLLLRRRFPFAAPALRLRRARRHVARRFRRSGRRGLPHARCRALAGARVLVRRRSGRRRTGSRRQPRSASRASRCSPGAPDAISSCSRRTATSESSPSSAIGSGLSLAAFALRRRTQRAVELERRATHLEREREERTRAAVDAERARIAADLHDVIAHSVSVMTVQAGAARLQLAESPERARKPLEAVEETGRQALAELRRLLGILRTDPGDPALAPQPGMADLSALLDRMRQAGLPVELAVEGGPEYSASGNRSCRLPHRRGGPDECARARRPSAGSGDGALSTARRSSSRSPTTGRGDAATATFEAASSQCASESRSTAGSSRRARGTGGGYAVSAHLPLAGGAAVTRWLRRHPDRCADRAARGRGAAQELGSLRARTRAVFIVASLLWTLPLLLRHRFPFAAPVFVFAVQAASSFADPAIGVEVTATIALLLAFWVVGAGNEGSRDAGGRSDRVLVPSLSSRSRMTRYGSVMSSRAASWAAPSA